jgi:hypothetical protein
VYVHDRVLVKGRRYPPFKAFIIRQVAMVLNLSLLLKSHGNMISLIDLLSYLIVKAFIPLSSPL